ncbi:MAG: cell division protein ZapD [Rhodoferax sp.]
MNDGVILYEYPLHERIRTYLRLEHLFARLHQLVARVDALDHHFALATLFEIQEVAARAELKSDLLKDLDRQRHQLESFRGNPAIADAVLERVLSEVEHCFNAINEQVGKSGQDLADNEWLVSLRNRFAIPAGTCAFDVPSYFAWQHRSGISRQADLQRWMLNLQPLWESVRLLLRMMRESGTPQKFMAAGGQFQLNLPQTRTFLLVRVAVELSLHVIPEISGNRLLVSLRWMRQGDDLRLQPFPDDVPFELALCS